MIWTFFIVGLLTALGCGINIVTAEKTRWQHEAVWLCGGLIGVAMMVFAILLERGVVFQ